MPQLIGSRAPTIELRLFIGVPLLHVLLTPLVQVRLWVCEVLMVMMGLKVTLVLWALLWMLAVVLVQGLLLEM